MRTGTHGIREQFRDQTEYREDLSYRWDKKKRFGTKSARGKTMLGKGDYRRAWLGGAGAIETVGKSSVEIGVDREMFPQVRIHQGSAPFVLIKPKRKTKSGQWKMKFAIHHLFGVWLTDATLERGLKVARRRLSISKDVRKAVAEMLTGAAKKKMGLSVQKVEAAA